MAADVGEQAHQLGALCIVLVLQGPVLVLHPLPQLGSRRPKVNHRFFQLGKAVKFLLGLRQSAVIRYGGNVHKRRGESGGFIGH